MTAQQVVVATHYPVLDPKRVLRAARGSALLLHCRARERTTAAGDVDQRGRHHTFEWFRDGDWLIIGGESHVAGARKATTRALPGTRKVLVCQHWDVTEVGHHWSAQDPTSWDLMPVVGPYHPGTSRIYVASGFHKWGLSCAGFAAKIISDQIAGRDNPWADAMSLNRVGFRGLPKVGELGLKFSADFVGDRLKPDLRKSVDDLPQGEARVVRDGVGKTGVYRDDSGELQAVSLRCTHLGCLLRWNGAEKSWDCRCHGSRFDTDGSVLEGPAVSPLEQKEI